MDLPLIPTPQKMKPSGGWLKLDRRLAVVLSGDTGVEDRFAAEYLCECLKAECEISAEIASDGGDAVPVKVSRGRGRKPEGYKLSITVDGVEIVGNDAPGVYYATQTLRQCFVRHGGHVMLPHLEIEDAPDLKYRSMHYDTKHHQDTSEYVQSFIRELAHYKVNVLVWEWEDKLEYSFHPEVGAPGAFTIAEMQELTRYARSHHVQIVPLVQGLGSRGIYPEACRAQALPRAVLLGLGVLPTEGGVVRAALRPLARLDGGDARERVPAHRLRRGLRAGPRGRVRLRRQGGRDRQGRADADIHPPLRRVRRVRGADGHQLGYARAGWVDC